MNDKNELTKFTNKENLELNKEVQKISVAITIAMRRTNSFDGIDDYAKSAIDIYDMFNYNVGLSGIIRAMKEGGMGKYGKNYKLTTQIIGFWVHSSMPKVGIQMRSNEL